MTDGLIIVGCGNMGYAMLQRWLSLGIATPETTIVVDPDKDNRLRVEQLGATTFEDAASVPSLSNQLIILAVKPQIIDKVAPQYSRFKSGSVFLSIAAGVTLGELENMIGHDAAIIRCMPNTPAAIGQGALVTFPNRNVTSSQYEHATVFLEANGQVTALSEEALIDAATALSGSGPAYVFHFIECLAKAGELLGLPRDTAEKLARQTVLGASSLACQSSMSLEALREQVTSPNGTTAAGLSALMTDGRLQEVMTCTLEAAHRRAIELGAPKVADPQ